MQRERKKEEVRQLHDMLSEAQLVIVAHFSGLAVSEMSDLRRHMRAEGARLRVAKNRLTCRALEGTKHKLLDSLLSGPTVLAISHDPIAAARVAVDYTHNYTQDSKKLQIQGGGLNGRLLTPEEVVVLARTPNIEESRARIVYLLDSPATALAVCLQEPASCLARMTRQRAEMDG